MVRFTLKDASKAVNIKIELGDRDTVSNIRDIVMEYWSEDEFILRNVYSLLRSDMVVGECICDGDIVEVLPDPMSVGRVGALAHRCAFREGTVFYRMADYVAWQAGWERTRTCC